MKILAVRFQNLNSLAGEWSVDLRHPAYEDQGLFAITGPTGAGKTTILDAVCLALYGRTPRLSMIKKSGNEILSRQTGECFAEVLFSTDKGIFCCHWSQHRARKKPTGELQDPKHELSCDGKILESSIKGVASRVEELTGMDFARFTRAVLLPQGDFAAFLQGTANERSSILEKMTGTEIYTSISSRVHERCSQARQSLADLQGRAEGLSLLDPEEERRCREELAVAEASEKALQQQLDEVQEALRRAEACRSCREEVRAREKARTELEQERRAQAPQEVLLQRDAAALQCLDTLKEVRHYRETVQQLEAACSAESQELARLSGECAEAREVVRRTEGELIHRRSCAEQRFPLLREARRRDTMIAAREQQAKEIGEHHRTACQMHDKWKQDWEMLGAQQQDMSRRREVNARERQNTSGDDRLVQELPRIHQACTAVQERQSQWLTCRTQTDEARQAAGRADQEAVRTGQVQEKMLAALRREQARQKDAQNKLEVLLEGKSLEAWGDEERCLAEKLRQLAEWQNLRAQMQEMTADRTRNEALHQQLEQERIQLNQALEQDNERLAVLQREAELLREIYVQQRTICDYQQARQHLHDGRPCPLCGALEHPYAEGVSVQPDVARENMTAQEARVQACQKDILARKMHLARIEEQWHQLETALRQSAAQESRLAVRVQTLWAEETVLLPVSLRTAPETMLHDCMEEYRVQLEQCRSLLQRARQGLEALRDAEAALRQADTSCTQASLAAREAVLHQEAARAEMVRRQQDQEQSWHALEAAQGSCAAMLLQYGVQSDFMQDSLRHALETLERRSLHRQHVLQQAESLHRDALLLEQKRQHIEENLAHTAEEVRKYDETLRVIRDDVQHLRQERMKLGVGASPEEEEEALTAAVTAAEQSREQARQQLNLLEQRLHLTGERLKDLQASASIKREASLMAEKALLHVLAEQGFLREDDVLEALLDDSRRQALHDQAEQLRLRTEVLHSSLEQAHSNLAAALLQRISALDCPALRLQAEGLWEYLRQQQQQIGACRQTLATAARQQEIRDSLLEEINRQKREVDRWVNLDQIIGAADGKPYRQFVQGLTFERLLIHANQQLQRLTDRYVLLADAAKHLEFQVMDMYQAGECRSARNLSGGESFLVSLALALGLSRMAGHSIKIESLFLDEGFGTLDEDALDAALSVLARLRQEGTLIGIISHVPALRERIPVQIHVIPEPGGRSRLEGEGCMRL